MKSENRFQSDFSDLTEAPTSYIKILKEANISRSDIERLSELKESRAWFDYLITILILFLSPLFFYFYPSILSALICVFCNLHVYNRFAQIVHGSDHRWLFQSKRLNDLMGNFAASFLGYSRDGHNLTHQQHHVYLNTDRDSDRIWGYPDEKISSLYRSWLLDIFGVTGFKRLLQYSQTERVDYTQTPWKNLNLKIIKNFLYTLRVVVLTQLTILIYYWFLIGFKYYFLLYMLPLITIYPALIRMRSLVEHSFETKESFDGTDRWVARSTNTFLIERFLIAPLKGTYHFEHHLFPSVPYYNLPAARDLLKSTGFPVPLTNGYVGYMLKKIIKNS